MKKPLLNSLAMLLLVLFLTSCGLVRQDDGDEEALVTMQVITVFPNSLYLRLTANFPYDRMHWRRFDHRLERLIDREWHVVFDPYPDEALMLSPRINYEEVYEYWLWLQTEPLEIGRYRLWKIFRQGGDVHHLNVEFVVDIEFDEVAHVWLHPEGPIPHRGEVVGFFSGYLEFWADDVFRDMIIMKFESFGEGVDENHEMIYSQSWYQGRMLAFEITENMIVIDKDSMPIMAANIPVGAVIEVNGGGNHPHIYGDGDENYFRAFINNGFIRIVELP